jgi:RNA polymerase sigma factor (TIGR02999 family)
MRQVLARDARRRETLKRGRHYARVPFEDDRLGADRPVAQLLTINDALADLERLHARQAQVVECRVYAGLSVAETARVLEVSTATVKRDWRAARAWLSLHLRAQE